MGGNSFLGLLFEISADPSKAQEALARFESATGQSLKRVADSTKLLNDSLLSNRDSVRLLSEEMGIRLPRAVSGAISEMLPGIASLGGALLGVFAVEQVYKWGTALWKEIEASHIYIDKTLDELNTHFKTSLAGTYNIKEIDARMNTLIAYHNAFAVFNDKAKESMESVGKAGAVIVDAAKDGLYSLADVDKKINEVGKEQFDAHKRMGEVLKTEAGERKKDAAAVERASREYVRQLHEELKAEIAVREERQKFGQGKTPDQQQEYQNTQRLYQEKARWEKDWERLVHEDAKIQEQDLKELHKAMQQIPHDMTSWTASLGQALPKFNQWKVSLAEIKSINTELTASVKMQVAAVQEDLIGNLENATVGIAGLIGGQKVAAEFKAGYEIAEGIACLATGTWPPNPPALVAAGLHFEAAAQYALMAGSGGGSRPSGGGGGSSAGGVSNISSGPGGGGGGGPAGPGGHGPTIIMNQYGPMVGTWADAGKAMSNVLNQLTKTGQVKLIATSALTNGPKQT